MVAEDRIDVLIQVIQIDYLDWKIIEFSILFVNFFEDDIYTG